MDVLAVINNMIELCEPIYYPDFNHMIKAKDVNKLREYEEMNPKVGISGFKSGQEGISVLSIIATITDVLCDKRMAFNINEDGYITRVSWYNE